MKTTLPCLLTALSCGAITGHAQAQELEPVCSVTDFGATADDASDDRAAIQSALDACDTVTLPAGTFRVGKGAGAFNLLVPAGRTLRGAGRTLTTLQQTENQAPAVRLLHVRGADVTLSDLTLDGNKANQDVGGTPNEHRHGVFGDHAERLALSRITSQNFTGDGFYLYTGSNDVVMDDVLATGNLRNGATYGGAGSHGGVVTNSVFRGNRAQQFDSEQGAGTTVDDLVITGSTFDGAGVSNDYVLTMSGSGSATPSHGWRVVGNTIHGGVFAVWLNDSVIAHNHGTNPTTKACFEINRRSQHVSVIGNSCTMTQTAVDSLAGVYVVGTGAANMPEDIRVSGNEITASGRAASMGVRVQGAVSVEIDHNTLLGPALSHVNSHGVYLRSTIANANLVRAIVHDNLMQDWGGAAIHFAINGAGTAIDYVALTDNELVDTSTPPTQRVGLLIDAGATPAVQVRTGNTCSGGTSCAGVNLP